MRFLNHTCRGFCPACPGDLDGENTRSSRRPLTMTICPGVPFLHRAGLAQLRASICSHRLFAQTRGWRTHLQLVLGNIHSLSGTCGLNEPMILSLHLNRAPFFGNRLHMPCHAVPERVASWFWKHDNLSCAVRHTPHHENAASRRATPRARHLCWGQRRSSTILTSFLPSHVWQTAGAIRATTPAACELRGRVSILARHLPKAWERPLDPDSVTIPVLNILWRAASYFVLIGRCSTSRFRMARDEEAGLHVFIRLASTNDPRCGPVVDDGLD